MLSLFTVSNPLPSTIARYWPPVARGKPIRPRKFRPHDRITPLPQPETMAGPAGAAASFDQGAHAVRVVQSGNANELVRHAIERGVAEDCFAQIGDCATQS
jgi:hypothetical protein